MPTASIKTDGKFKAVGIEEAVAHTSTKLNEIIKKYGADSVAVFASPKLTNEDLYLTQKLARAGIKTNNISSLTGLLFNKEEENLDELFGATVSTTTVDSIKNTDLIVLMNADLEEENLIMELKIKAAKRKGVKLITINSVETNLTKFSDLWVDTRKGTNTVLINGVINEIIAKSDSKNVELKKMVSEFNADSVCDFTGISKDKYLELVKMLDDSKQNIVFIYNLDSLKEKSRNDIKAISNFLSATDRITKEKNGLIIIREYSNSIGLQDMGVTPNYLPGYVKFNEKEAINSIGKQWNTNLNDIFKPSDILKKLLDRDIKAVLIFGEDPVSVADNIKYFNSVEFMLVCDSHTTETAKMADVIIPASSYIEQNGTYTTCDTKIQIAEPVIKNKYNLENWEIISKLAEKFGIKSKYNSAKDVFEEIKKVNRIYNSCQIDDYWNEKPFNRDFFKTQKKISYFNYRIDLTTFNPIKNSIHYSDNYFEDNINRKLKVITKING
jgi:formate dehydrogenase major subunit